MRMMIIGAAGMVGRKLTERLLNGNSDVVSPTELFLYDMFDAPSPKTKIPYTVLSGNIANKAESEKLAALSPDVVFHLASIVSGEAELEFDKGWQVNAHGGWQLLEALRTKHDQSGGSYRPKVIFTSSIAVFGPPFPDAIDDEFLCAPQTSYGAQKAMVELLLADYSRKGFVNGVSIRLPTICVRPGKPNLAASSFFSGIIREPLNGVEALLPVSDDVRHWHASPRSAAKFLTHAAGLNLDSLNGRRSLNMPGLSCTVAEQIEALRDVAGDKTVSLIVPKPDERIVKIVSGWPRNFTASRAKKLGFSSEETFADIIKVYLEDDFEGNPQFKTE